MSVPYQHEDTRSVAIIEKSTDGSPTPKYIQHVIGYRKKRGKKGGHAVGATSGGDDHFNIQDYTAQTVQMEAGPMCTCKGVIPGLDATFCPKCVTDQAKGGTYYVDPESAKDSLIAKENRKAIQSGAPFTPEVIDLFSTKGEMSGDKFQQYYQPSLFASLQQQQDELSRLKETVIEINKLKAAKKKKAQKKSNRARVGKKK